jgi:hypothetical protein
VRDHAEPGSVRLRERAALGGHELAHAGVHAGRPVGARPGTDPMGMRNPAATEVIARHREGCVVVCTMSTIASFPPLSPGPWNIRIAPLMGGASSVALGIALARPDRRVLVLDGDGSLAMQLGTLLTIAGAAAPNLLHFVFANGVLSEGGGRLPTAGAGRVDWPGLALRGRLRRSSLLRERGRARPGPARSAGGLRPCWSGSPSSCLHTALVGGEPAGRAPRRVVHPDGRGRPRSEGGAGRRRSCANRTMPIPCLSFGPQGRPQSGGEPHELQRLGARSPARRSRCAATSWRRARGRGKARVRTRLTRP